MISKELLSEVLGYEAAQLREASDFLMYKIIIDEIVIDEIGINIYELAHKCKEWANKKNIHISSDLYLGGGYRIRLSNIDKNYKSEKFNADTEPEAIFKACQWILENKC